MKAIQILTQGSPEVLQLTDLPTPTPKEGEVLVRVDIAGINYADVYQRNGQNPAVLPAIPGTEGAGVVAEGNAHLPAGTRVAWLSQPGSYAEYLSIPTWKLVRLPDDISNPQAAAVIMQGVTVQYLAETSYQIKAGDRALVHAGAGGVGLLLIQLLKHKGATVLTTVSTAAKEELARQAGADHVIRYTETDFVAAVKALSQPQGVNVVYDSVGLNTYQGSMAVLGPLGSLVLFGQSSGNVPPIDPMTLCRSGSLFFTRPTLAHHVADAASLAARSQRVLGWLREGILRPRIGGSYPLAQAAQAHADLESSKTTGKLLLTVNAAN
ncbi:quinone oxidoreductase family protein [Undibacterium sp. Ji50W]|uniref:quinone oxidoreductase family protein n=1 Tax=Undibacterium sp. Ji50W TaxID=3413041 RepID=UPI003BEF7D4B